MTENETKNLKLTGFKYFKWIVVMLLGYVIVYSLLVFVFQIKVTHMVVWFPLFLFIYPTYFITLGKNKYLRLTEDKN